MQTIPLKATPRTEGKKAPAIRREGFVPCIVYGNEVKNMEVQCFYNDIRRAYTAAGESTIVELDVGEKKIPVLFHAMDLDAVKHRITHVDFYAVNMKKEIETHIPLKLEGEAPAVKELGAILVTVMDHVTVRCLPADLPHDIPVSIESLKEFHDQLTVSDLKAPKGVVIKDDPTAVIITVQEPRKEEEIAPPPPAEGEVPAEGAVAAEGAPAAEGGPGAEAAKKPEGDAGKKEAKK